MPEVGEREAPDDGVLNVERQIKEQDPIAVIFGNSKGMRFAL